MPVTASYLRELAHRCIRLARESVDRRISHELEAVAMDLMEKAAELEKIEAVARPKKERKSS
jgi:hypothetical protein